jgi:hypothetical protein
VKVAAKKLRKDQRTEKLDFLSEELRLQYALAYRPAKLVADGAFRKIRIEPADKRYGVRARNGYYAPRPSVK